MTFLCIYDSILDIHKFIAILRAEGERKPPQNEQNTRRTSIQCRRQKQFPRSCLLRLEVLGRVAAEAAGAVKKDLEDNGFGRDSDEYAANDSLAPEVSEPPKPTPLDIRINEQKDKARDAVAKHSTNPEGLTPYEQAMRDKYLGDEYDDAEKTEDDVGGCLLLRLLGRGLLRPVSPLNHTSLRERKRQERVGCCYRRIEKERIGIHAS